MPRVRPSAPTGAARDDCAPSANHTPHTPARAAPVPTAVGYLRRSTDRQEQSIGDQRAAVERCALDRGLRLIRCYTDDAISGTSVEGRRAFQRLIDDARSPARDFSFVIVYDVKRFGRVDNDEAGYYRHILKRAGVEVLYASENFTGDGTDDLLRPVKQWQARQESKDLAKVVIRGLTSKAGGKQGWWMGGAPPLGYDLRYESQSGEFLFRLRYERDGSKTVLDDEGSTTRRLARGETMAVSKKDRARLVPGDPERVETVQLLFRLYTEERLGLKATADALNRAGRLTARSPGWSAHWSGRWSLGAVRSTLLNPAYTGDLAWNRRTDARFFRIAGDGSAVERKGVLGRRLAPNDPADWIVVKDAHEPLVPRWLWEAAQERLLERGEDPHKPPRRNRTPRPPTVKRGFLLSRLVTCSRCGSRYEGRTERPSTKDAQPSRAYACGGYIRQGKSVCSRGTIKQTVLEQAVLAAVGGFYTETPSNDLRRAIEEASKARLALDAEHARAHRESATQRLAELDSVTRALLDNITERNRAHVDRRLAEIDADRAALTATLEDLDRAALTAEEAKQEVEETLEFLAALPGVLTDGPIEAKRAALVRCVKNIAIDREKCAVTLEVRDAPFRTPAAPGSRNADEPTTRLEARIKMSA